MSGFQSILLRTWVFSLGKNEEWIGHKSEGGLCSLVHAASLSFMIPCARHIAAQWCQGLSSHCPLPRDNMASLQRLWSRSPPWGCRFFVSLHSQRSCLSSLLLPLDTLLKGLKTVTTGHFPSQTHTSPGREPLGRHWTFQDQHLLSLYEVS